MNSQLRRCKQRLVPAACWRAGRRVEGLTVAEDLSPFPNPTTVLFQASSYNEAVYRDPEPPAALLEQQQQQQVAANSVAAGGGGGGVRMSAAAAGGVGWSPRLGCSEARLWPGGPAATADHTCCGPMAVGTPAPPLIQFRPPRI